MTVLYLFLLMVAAYGAGSPIARWLLPSDDRAPLLDRMMTIWLGAGLLGLLAMLGNVLWLLPRPVALGVLMSILLYGIYVIWKDRTRWSIPDFRWEDAGGIALLGGMYLWYVISSWYPWLMVDSYSYHFVVPKQWLMEGGFREVPYEAHANFYQLWSGWLFWGIALEPDNFLLPRQFVMLGLLSVALMVVLEARRMAGTRLVAWAAGLAWMVTMEAFEVSLSDYMDMLLAGMILIAAINIQRAMDQPAPGGRYRCLALAGLAAGFAIGLKITGLALAFCMGTALLVIQMGARLGWRDQLRGAAIYGLSALGLAAPWAIKNLVVTGNPVYPFALGLFGAAPEHLQVAMDFHGFYGAPPGEDSRLVHNFWAHLDLYRRLVAYVDPNRIVAAFLLVTLILALPRWRSRPIPVPLMVLAISLLPLAMILPARRFQLAPLVVIYLFTAVGGGVLASELARRAGWWLRPLCAVLALMLIGGRIQYVRDTVIHAFLPEANWMPRRGWLTVGEMRRHAYALHPGWPAVVWLEENLPSDRRVLVTWHEPLTPMLDVRVMANPHIHGESVLVQMTELEGNDLATFEARLEAWQIGAIYTEVDFDRNPVLAAFRDRRLEPVMTIAPFTLFRVKAAEP
jgi:hypothetical protein